MIEANSLILRYFYFYFALYDKDVGTGPINTPPNPVLLALINRHPTRSFWPGKPVPLPQDV
jgi:hypothetical protein